MSDVTFSEAKEFFEGISSDDNVAVIHHDDTDGFASGILFYDYCRRKGASVFSIPFKLSSNQNDVVKQVRKASKVIISDLGPNTILTILDSVRDKLVFYTDHHQKDVEIPKEILEFRTVEQGYIPSSRTAYELVGGKYWLAVCGVLGDMGHTHKANQEFLDVYFQRTRIPLEKFNREIVFTLNQFLNYFHDRKKKAFKILLKIEDYKDIKKFKKYARPIEKEIQGKIEAFKKDKEQIGDVTFFYFESKYPVKSTIATKLSFQNARDLLVFGVPDGEKVQLSARSQNPKANMIEVLKTGMKGLKDCSAGGHVPAAGGHIQKKDLERFKKNLKNYSL